MFEPSFPREWAEEILKRLQAWYGTAFDREYPIGSRSQEQYLNDMVLMACEVLDGLTGDQIKTGLAKAKSAPWFPNLPKFRSLCEQGGEWFTPEEAWAKALVGWNGGEVTIQIRKAMDLVGRIYDNEGQKAAARAFKDIYARQVQEDQEAGRKQETYKPPALPKPPEPEPLSPEQQELAKKQAAEYLENLKKLMKA